MPDVTIEDLKKQLADVIKSSQQKESDLKKIIEEEQKKVSTLQTEKIALGEKLVSTTKSNERLNIEIKDLKRKLEDSDKLKRFYEEAYQKSNVEGTMSIEDVASSIATSVSIANEKLASNNLSYSIDDFNVELRSHIDLTHGLKVIQLKPELQDTSNSSVLSFSVKAKITTKEVQ